MTPQESTLKPDSNTEQALQTLMDIGQTVVTVFDTDTSLPRIVNEAMNISRADAGYLLLLDPVTDELYPQYQHVSAHQSASGFDVADYLAPAAQVVRTHTPCRLTQPHPALHTHNRSSIGALLCVPLIFGGEVLGVLNMVRFQPDFAFQTADEAYVQALANWAAIALANKQFYRQARRGARSTELITEISRSVLASLHSHEIPAKLIKHTTEIFGAECGSLALLDSQSRELVFQMAYDTQGKEIAALRQMRFPLGQGIIGLVAQDGQARIVNDVRQNPDWYAHIDPITNFTTQKVLAVPLKFEGQVLGVVELLNKQEGPFNQDDQDLLLAVASAAAIAIQNARQFKALERTNQALQAEQQQRIASEQWSILGRASAGLAHRIHNTTAIVLPAVDDIRERLTSASLSPTARQSVEAGLERISRNSRATLDLVDALLKRFHQGSVAADDVNALVQEALAELSIPDNIVLKTSLASNLPPVNTSDLLRDAILELCANAIKAMPDGGQLHVSTEAEDEQVFITVADTGIGITKARQKKIFTLFYSQNGNGLGFGLWWVRTFLQQYGGDIELESTPGVGSTFRMCLPQASVSPAPGLNW